MAELQVRPGLAPVLGFGHLVAEALEHGAQCHARDGVIFGKEQIHRVRPGGFEPPTNSLEGCCSIHLSYGRAMPNLMRSSVPIYGRLTFSCHARSRETPRPAHPRTRGSPTPGLRT